MRLSKFASVLAAFVIVALIAGCAAGRLIKIVDSSMEPTLKPGDIVRMQEVSSSSVNVGDIAVFEADRGLGVARVVSIDKEKGVFTAKGDANKAIGNFEKDVSLSKIQGIVKIE